MRVRLKFADGREQSFDVASAVVEDLARPVERTAHAGPPTLLRPHAAGDAAAWPRLVLHPGACNVANVEVRLEDRCGRATPQP